MFCLLYVVKQQRPMCRPCVSYLPVTWCQWLTHPSNIHGIWCRYYKKLPRGHEFEEIGSVTLILRGSMNFYLYFIFCLWLCWKPVQKICIWCSWSFVSFMKTDAVNTIPKGINGIFAIFSAFFVQVGRWEIIWKFKNFFFSTVFWKISFAGSAVCQE